MPNLETIGQAIDRIKLLVQKGWTKGVDACDKEGRDVSPSSISACEWCLQGAIQAVSFSEKLHPYALEHLIRDELLGDYYRKFPFQHVGTTIIYFNDHHNTTREDVITLLDMAKKRWENHSIAGLRKTPGSF